MKIALLTVDGQAYSIAYHLQEEGHEVYVGVVQDWSAVQVKTTEKAEDRRKRLELYDGLFTNKWPISKLMSFLLGQPDGRRGEWFVICDFNWLWPFADKLRRAGFGGLLPHREDFMLEHDRRLARDLVKNEYSVVETGNYHEFKKTADAIKFLEKDGETLFCLKGFNADAETIVPDTNDPDLNHEILVDALEIDKDHNYEKDGFILEEKIPDAIEFTPEAYGYDGKLRSVSVDVEHKRIGSRNGPMTGCAMDCVIWQELESPLYEMFLEPLSKRMLRPKELTIWDLSVFYSPSRKKFYAGEFCANRMGFNAVFTEICTFESTSAWLEFVLGEEREHDPVGVSIRVFNQDKRDKIFIGDPADRNVWCFDIKRDGDKLHTNGLDKNAYVLTESASDIFAAIDELYQLEDKVQFDPGYNLQKHDWYDSQWPQNILHRIEVIMRLGLIGGENNAETKKGRIEDQGNANRGTEESRTAAAKAAG